MKFKKMHGNGNDFIVIEDLNNMFKGKEAEIALKLCHRNFGVGGDGILLVRHCKEADIEMVIINSDGSFASMCGNGIRCFAKYVYDENIVKKSKINIKTGDGIKEVNLIIEEDKVKEIIVYMGKPSLEPFDIPALSEDRIISKSIEIEGKKYEITSLHMGVPHTVIIDKLDKYNIEEGRLIESHSIFPEKTNVDFCEIIDRENIKVKTWERGAGATLACGTGNCASAYVAHLLGYIDNEVKVIVDGGELKVKIEDQGIYMIGNAKDVFEGFFLMEY
ncbi:diaminopimelate epimerase [Clostridium amazonitimonense]|uniref:diaminopimelate epimerase n=1 Tax=Clostridium amazonitimonense TaxID=1499689 RepID=UPI0005094A8F|nr:diaminopimelate epimerase [Clostridium amazonitimonense]